MTSTQIQVPHIVPFYIDVLKKSRVAGKVAILQDVTKEDQFSLLEKEGKLARGSIRLCIVVPIDAFAVSYLMGIYDGATNIPDKFEVSSNIFDLTNSTLAEYADLSGEDMLEFCSKPELFLLTVNVG